MTGWKFLGTVGLFSLLLAACASTEATALPTPRIMVHVPTMPTPLAHTETALPLPSSTPLPTASDAPTATQEVSATETITPTDAVPSGLTLTASEPINVRKGPGTEYDLIGQLSSNSTASIIGRSANGQWALIIYQDGQAWVYWSIGHVQGDITQAPIVAAPSTPTRPPVTATPLATATPKASATVSVSARGVRGKLELCDASKPSFATIIERICFVETIYNQTNQNIDYGLLGVQATNLSGGKSQFQTSWSGELRLNGNGIGPVPNGGWEDGIFLQEPGTYRLTLEICYSPLKQCSQSTAEWETLTSGIIITVIDWTPSP